MLETPGVVTYTADYANRHPQELRAHADDGEVVRITDTSEAGVRVYWFSADPPPWYGTDAMPDDTPEIERFLHRERSAARRAAWARRRVSA